MMVTVAVGLLAWAALALPATRAWLEASLVTHMLVQLPALVGVGYALGIVGHRYVGGRLARFNDYGIATMLLAAFSLLYWLLPRSLDETLLEGEWELAKFLAIPLLVGMPLALSWLRLGVIGRAFVGFNFGVMLTAMGVLYLVAQTRLCSNYLLADQQLLGYVALTLGVVTAVSFIAYLLAASGRSAK